MHSSTLTRTVVSVIFISMLIIQACSSRKKEVKEEQIRVEQVQKDSSASDTTLFNTIRGNLALNQIPTSPSVVILTGINEHRLLPLYKNKVRLNSRRETLDEYGYRSYSEETSDREEHFMPGLDLLYGYNLVNVAHYNLKTEKLNYLFNRPVLVKSLYYPSFVPDSLDKKPIHRNYYLASVYDADTNGDTLISRLDLRRFYYLNAEGTEKIQLLPEDYSAQRSQYDPRNDVMYIFAFHDANSNGIINKKEPLHVFWIDLKNPVLAKRFY